MSMIVFAAALAVVAAPEPAPAPAPIAPAATMSVEKVSPSTDMRRVCVVDTTTGTRFARKVCQTRADWIAQGVDPLAKR